MKRLFLTGPIGCGKSTAIAQALGEKLSYCGGFLTKRHRKPHLHFTLESPDGSKMAVFLDFPQGKPQLSNDVFSKFGVELLKGSPIILDEIGGTELLCPEFMDALDMLLNSTIPIIGVIKGEAPASSLIRTLGLSAAYEEAVSRLRTRLQQDPETLVYECKQFDESALTLAENWVKENFP